MAQQLPTDTQKKLLFAYYQHAIDTPGPKIAGIPALDDAPVGSFWGEVQATIHKALVCQGSIRNGRVRDFNEVEALNGSNFASEVLVSHGNIHVEQRKVPVTFAGLAINPCDLPHADKHAVVHIPNGIAH